MITKLGRQQFGKQPMILMSVVALRTEHHIWGARSAEITQVILDSFPMCGRPTVRYVEDRDLDVGTGTERRPAPPAPRPHARCRRRTARVRAHAAPDGLWPGSAACRPSRSRCRRNAHRRPRFRSSAPVESGIIGPLQPRPVWTVGSVLPHHPRSIATVVSGVEFGPFLEGVGGLPEPVVPIAEQPSLPCQRAADVRDEVAAGRQEVENLLGEHEESAIFPDRQLGNRG